MNLHLYCLFILSGVSSCVLTWLLRRYALAQQVLDVPNERSSHTVPTPRGGGVAIVASFLVWLVVLALGAWVPWRFAIALAGAGICVALVGFIDDHRSLAACWRLLAHCFGAAWILLWLDGPASVSVFGYSIALGWVGYVVAGLYLVWLLNLYNFMDGIDGLASVEAMTVCLGGVVLYRLGASGTTAWIGPFLLFWVVAGFLGWNFPRAKIFMGDAGSGFIGLMLGALSIQAANHNPVLFWGWVIMLGGFVVDATVTLLHRLVRGERVYLAHRSHAYQYASRKVGRHSPVTYAFAIINLFWLLPLAVLVVLGLLDGLTGLLIAYIPLIWLAVHFKAGSAEIRQ